MHPVLLAVFIGIVGGMIAVLLNVRALTATPRSPSVWGGWLFVLAASAAGLAAFRVTLEIESRHLTIEGPVRFWGWPFPMVTDSMWGGPVGGPGATIGNIMFWLLAPQIVVCLYWLHLRTK